MSQESTVQVQDWQVTATTEVQITTATPSSSNDVAPRSPTMPRAAMTHPSHQHDDRPQISWREAETGGGHSSASPANHPRFETMISSNPCPPAAKAPMVERIRTGKARLGSRFKGLDPVKLAYLRTSFIFAISILVTWTPSSINRVNDLVRPQDNSYGLNVATAIVLPLQGVWNAVIFFMTSWDTCKEEYRNFLARRAARRMENRAGSRLGGNRIQVLRGDDQKDHYDMMLFERTKRPGSDETSEQELTGRASSSHDHIMPIQGGF